MVCVVASGAFYLQSPSTPQTTFIFMQREEILHHINSLFFCMRKEEKKQERNVFSLICLKGNSFTPVVMNSITFSSSAPLSAQLFS